VAAFIAACREGQIRPGSVKLKRPNANPTANPQAANADKPEQQPAAVA